MGLESLSESEVATWKQLIPHALLTRRHEDFLTNNARKFLARTNGVHWPRGTEVSHSGKVLYEWDAGGVQTLQTLLLKRKDTPYEREGETVREQLGNM